jgi:DnaJ-class molecular chaperone
MEDETEECPDCNGNGAVNGVPCRTCAGFGYLEEDPFDDVEPDDEAS